MRALPMWQPWATLVALGAKRIETRHWAPPAALVGQRIAIHACKTTAQMHTCGLQPFSVYIRAPELVPLGAVIATVELIGCRLITDELAAGLTAHERAFGDYTPGRFAWDLADPRPVWPVLAWKGSQGIFDVPEELLEQTLEQDREENQQEYEVSLRQRLNSQPRYREDVAA